MTTKMSKRTEAAQRTHDRSAMIQWAAIGMVIVLALVAIVVLTEGSTTIVQG